MSQDKKEKTKTLSEFGFNVDSDNSKFNEIPTITNLLGRKKLTIKKIEKETKDFTKSISLTLQRQTKTTPPSTPTPSNPEDQTSLTKTILSQIDLVSPPEDSFHFKTITGFDKQLPLKDNSQILNSPLIKKISHQRGAKLKHRLTQNSGNKKSTYSVLITEFLQSGAESALFLKKTPENTYIAFAYEGPKKLFNFWNGIEYKKSVFPDFFDEMLKEQVVGSLDKIHSKKNLVNCFGLNPNDHHYFSQIKNPESESGFIIISAGKKIEMQLRSAYLKHTKTLKAA